MTSIGNRWNLLRELISLEIKQSYFKMIYGHVCSSWNIIKFPLHPLWAWKIKISFKKIYPKQGSSVCWNSVQDKRSIKNIYRKKSKKKGGHIKSSRIKKKKEKREVKKKIGVINSNKDDWQNRKRKNEFSKNMNCFVQYLVDGLCYKKNDNSR